MTRLTNALAAALALQLASAAHATTPADQKAWAASIDYSVIADPKAPMTPAAERAFFRRYMVENFKTWSPGTAPFDIAVPAPFYQQTDRFFGFDVFPPSEGFAGWDAYRTELTKIMGNVTEFNVMPEPESLRYGRNGDVAWMSMLVRVSGTLKNGQPVSVPVRNSLVLERIGGKWLIAHEHVSTPLVPSQ